MGNGSSFAVAVLVGCAATVTLELCPHQLLGVVGADETSALFPSAEAYLRVRARLKP